MKSKKLIIFIPSIEGGGVEKNFFLISNYLAKKFDNVSLITSSKNIKNINSKIKIITTKKSFILNSSRIFKILHSMFLLTKELFLNSHSVILSFQANFYAILICKFFNTKIIARSNASPSGWSKNNLKLNAFKLLLKYPKAVIVNSVEFKKEMKKKFNINSKCIFNPLNKSKILKLSKKKISRNVYKYKSSLKLISVGRLVDQKDHLTLLKAIKLIHLKCKVELLIIGRGVNELSIKKFIFDNNLSKKIKVINFQKNPFPYIKISDALILSSKYEGLPNVLLEALALNKPIISSDCPTGPKEILLNGKGGLLYNVGDYKTLSKKILFMKKNYKKCIYKTKYAKKRLNRYDEKENLEKYNKLISSIMNK